MAFTKVSRLGLGIANNMAVLKNEADYKRNDASYWITSTTNGVSLPIVKAGTDLTPIFNSAPWDTEILLITLTSGYKIYGKKIWTSSGVGYDKNKVKAYTTAVDIIVRNASGTQVGQPNTAFPITWYERYGARVSVPFYLFCAIDEEARKAVFGTIMSKINTWANVSDNNFVSVSTCQPYPNNYYFDNTSMNSYSFLNGSTSEYDIDPWSGAGYAGTAGGGGTFDFSSDTVGLPALPATTARDTGFIKLYSANVNEIGNLSSYLWTNDFLTNLVKITQNPLDIIVSLQMFPFSIASTVREYVQAGNIKTDIVMGIPENSVVEIDCGSLELLEFYGTYMDFSPFTTCEIFLPFCGFFKINVDDIMGKTVSVKYRVDLFTGSCIAFIIVDGSVLYYFSGLCSANVPVTSANYLTMYQGLLNVGAGVVGGFANDGFSGIIGNTTGLANSVMGTKPSYTRGNSLSGNNGMFSPLKPYFIFTLPNVAIPKKLASYTGYPAYISYKLADLQGFTVVEEIHLDNIDNITESERTELERLLKGGVIL